MQRYPQMICFCWPWKKNGCY